MEEATTTTTTTNNEKFKLNNNNEFFGLQDRQTDKADRHTCKAEAKLRSSFCDFDDNYA